MKRVLVTLAAVALLVAASAFSATTPTASGQNGKKEKIRRSARPVPNSYIVVLKEWAAQPYGEGSFVPNVAADLAAAHNGRVKRHYKHALLGFSVELTEEQAERLADDPRVEYVEEDGVVTASATQTSPPWGLDRIDQRDLPLNSAYNYTPTGAGVNAYIIDTGIRRTHQDFGGRAYVGYDAIGDGQNSNDCNGHGTHVAGTVGGSTYGVAKGVRLYAVRVLNCQGSGTNSGVIAGVDWVRQNRVLPAVANMSLGGGASSSLDTAVNNLINSGVTVAVAAGNDSGQDACNYSPARVANALTVGSTTSSDARSSFSNIGTCLDIFAPGSSIPSAWHTSDTATNTISGTSMATPHVAGVAALYLQNNTGASPSTVASQIINTATTGKVTSAGTGSPNRLLYSLLTTDGGGGGAPCTGCTQYTGTLSGTGDYDYHPNGSYYYSSVSGYHKGWLRGPTSGADFDLYLQKWNGSSWSTVARAESSTSSEDISYYGTAGYYRWLIYSYSGSGSYNFWLSRP
jgi:aqualysin 1